ADSEVRLIVMVILAVVAIATITVIVLRRRAADVVDAPPTRGAPQVGGRRSSERFCTQCGAAAAGGDRYCGNCGAALR
ncbi:MAG: zinc ribbon domain-containing protein, partial [Acidobacteriota bacterium]